MCQPGIAACNCILCCRIRLEGTKKAGIEMVWKLEWTNICQHLGSPSFLSDLASDSSPAYSDFFQNQLGSDVGKTAVLEKEARLLEWMRLECYNHGL